MEWLSHSQKKYCELCKTSFRFTKLYHPGMPPRIPTSVFLRRAAVHILKLFMTWCRALLVVSVWLVLLPWCMRVVWRSLFWVGDGGWNRDDYSEAIEAKDPVSTPSPVDLDAMRSAVQSAKAFNTTLNLPLPSLMMPYSQTLNMSAGEPTIWTIVKRFFFGFPQSFQVVPAASSPNRTDANNATDYLGPRSPSLLSDLSFLNWFPSQAANRFLIDVLEGLIITLLVVVAFILVFLIREWVVQQQPVINLVGLGDDAAANRMHDDHEEDEEQVEEDQQLADDIEPDRPTAEAIQEYAARDDRNHIANEIQENVPEADEEHPIYPTVDTRRSPLDPRNPHVVFQMWQDSEEIPEDLKQAMSNGTPADVARIIDRMPIEDSIKLKEALVKPFLELSMNTHDINPRDVSTPSSIPAKSSPLEPEGSSSSNPIFPERSSSFAYKPESVGENPAESSSSSQRPHMPARDRSFIATEIRRSLEEGNSWSFADIPESSTIPRAMSTEDHIPNSWEDEAAEHSHREKGAHQDGSDREHGSDHSSESWQHVPDIVVENNDPESEGSSNSDDGASRGESHQNRHMGLHSPKRFRDHDDDDTAARSKKRRQVLSDATAQATAPHDSSAGPQEIPSSNVKIGESLDVPPSDEGVEVASNESACGSDSYREESETDEQEPLAESQPPSEQSLDEEQEQEQEPLMLPPARLLDRIMDWVFADVAPAVQPAEEPPNDDEHVVQNLADEAPFVPFGANELRGPADVPVQDPEVAAAAAQAGIDVNDQDAIEDAEDLEGIMELIGMQGPLTGLFQNAMFSAVLISATLACAVWLPYLWGKVVILFMGSPISLFVKLPLQLIAALADLVVDGALCIAAGIVYGTLEAVVVLVKVATLGMLNDLVARPIKLVAGPAYSISASAADRLSHLMTDSPLLPPPTYFRLSVNSHVALRTIQNTTSHAFNQSSAIVANLCNDVTRESASTMALRALRHLPSSFRTASATTYNKSTALMSWLLTTKSYKITFDLDLGRNVSAAYAAVEQWTATDRLIAILAGYTFFAVAGAVYLKRGAPFSTSRQGQRMERVIAEFLQQAGGVLKVILIISIEMLIFPLYCGLLLDLALLPLFQNATVYTRWQFTRESPWTSGFVHWFIGTCYMFHFALFVSMCRKIMRRGVLYFIRDPDDPTFHPVRDVLERSVTTQLRKIAFSALVYGALVIVCLGGVVYSLNQLTIGVLPIHWVSHAPSLEFPLDLLFYNFLTPVVVKLYKPSDGLHAISQWWFKRCARILRLSNFLFGDKNPDEEGHKEDNGSIAFDGKYVRAPASDQVRIPKGEPVFIEVDKDNNRKDGKTTEEGVHNTDLVTLVYIPPWFRVRIALFVFTIWIFAAVTGVSVTIIPLLFGRYLFSLFLPKHVEMNDIHAVSLGVYSLGSIVYTFYQGYKFLRSVNRPVPSPLATLYTIAATTVRISLRIIRFAYVWGSLLLVIPLLCAVLIELYFLMPLHAYLGPTEPHVVHLIQDWTLGFLYARLAARLIFSDRASRPARAFSAVVSNGYLNPNARIATRCFLIPAIGLFAAAIVMPSIFALVVNKTAYYAADATTKSHVWRFSYPAVGLAILAVWAGKEGLSVMRRWRMVVRDEVYLIGERLHNFGERRAPALQNAAVYT